MNKPLFLTRPGAWTAVPRSTSDLGAYSAAITRFQRRATWRDRALRAAAVLLALVALAVWSAA